MKWLVRRFGVASVLILPLMAVMSAPAQPHGSPPQKDSVSLWQARRTLIAATEYVNVLLGMHSARIGRNSIRFTLDSFEFDAIDSKGKTQHFKVDLTTLEPVSIKQHSNGYDLKNENGQKLPSPLNLLLWNDYHINFLTFKDDPACSPGCTQSAMSSSAAINRLRTSATEVGSPLRDFEQRAAAWHSLAAKPPLPEDIREQRLLAENAVKEKQLEEALHYYEVALERYPVWPEGWFNAALIAGELGYYADAVEHMQAYLELMPDAPDAQAARDQVVIWRAKSKS